MSYQLEVAELAGGYGPLQILWDINLTVGVGERVALIGSNGSGKTTLLKTLVGLNRTWHGRIALDGSPVDQLRVDQRIRRGMAYLSETGIIPSLSVQENLVIGGYHLTRAQMARQTERLYTSFPILKERRRSAGGSLSGGQRKILGLAKALMTEPRVLIMDEPSAGLSPLLTNEIIDILGTFHHGHLAYLIAEQNIRFLDLADRVYVMESGRIKYSGTVSDLRQNDAVRQAYFGLEA